MKNLQFPIGFHRGWQVKVITGVSNCVESQVLDTLMKCPRLSQRHSPVHSGQIEL